MTQPKANQSDRLAQTTMQLYYLHGLGEYANWLNMQVEVIKRQDVVNSLLFESTMKCAEHRIAALESQLTELRELVAEARHLKNFTVSGRFAPRNNYQPKVRV